MFDYPGVGEKKSFLLYHEELESLAKNLKGLKRIRFWMTFGEAYLKHLEVLQNIGMTRIDEVEFNGQKIVPIKFLRALLPDPASLAAELHRQDVDRLPLRGHQGRQARSATSSTTSATTRRRTRKCARRRSRTRPACPR